MFSSLKITLILFSEAHPFLNKFFFNYIVLHQLCDLYMFSIFNIDVFFVFKHNVFEPFFSERYMFPDSTRIDKLVYFHLSFMKHLLKQFTWIKIFNIFIFFFKFELSSIVLFYVLFSMCNRKPNVRIFAEIIYIISLYIYIRARRIMENEDHSEYDFFDFL